MKQAQVDAGLRDRLREFTQDTTRLSSPGDGETFIPGAVQGWNLDDYMARFAKQLDMPMLANGKRKTAVQHGRPVRVQDEPETVFRGVQTRSRTGIQDE